MNTMQNLPPPTPQRIRRLLYDYYLARWKAARLLGIAHITFNRYCLPLASKHHYDMPQHRWTALVDHLRAARHPDRPVEFRAL